MKPLILHGHERAITQIKYNREGDLLFSCAKDHSPNVWYSINGERLGTLDGHTGAVWCVDVNWDTTRAVSGAGDNTCRLWDCRTGVEVGRINTPTAVRTCNFSYSGKWIMYTTDSSLGRQCEIRVVDISDESQMGHSSNTIMTIVVEGSKTKVTSSLWGALDETLITGHESGEIAMWDIKTGKKVKSIQDHTGAINDLQFNKDQTMFISASRDHTAKLFDSSTFQLLKTYKTERPVNSASISPIRDHVVLGGGQEAMDVTTTAGRVGKFDARFCHLIFEEEFARVKDHFGPINSVAFHPDGKSYSSGGEDGYVRVHYFDPAYFEFQFEY